MAIERVYFVPGLAESTISAVNAFGLDSGIAYFANVNTFLLGQFGALRLATDGTSPGPPDGVDCAAFNVLGPYALFPTYQLNLQPDFNTKFVAYPFAWDWRKSILTAGDTLAALISSTIGLGEKCSLVCHSAGGVVARRAWWNLKQQGMENRIRRIVTIGSPHWGSYFVAFAWSGGSTFLTTLYDWNQWALQTIPGITLVAGWHQWTFDEVIQLSQTWPALYELLPVVGAPDASLDPNRAALFTANNWRGNNIPSQAWLTHASTTFRDWSLSADAMPPQEVFVAVTGLGYSTPNKLVDPSQLGSTTAIGSTDAGDSIVSQGSALPPLATLWEILSMHQDQYPDSVNNGNITFWLTLEIPPAPTPPPEGAQTQQPTANLVPAPLASPFLPQHRGPMTGHHGFGNTC